MASIGREGQAGDRKRIVFRLAGGKQTCLRLGKCSDRDAIRALTAMEHLLQAHQLGTVPHPDAVAWLSGLNDTLYGRVVRLGLAQPRISTEKLTLAELSEQFFAVVDVKPTSLIRMQQAHATLLETFGEDRDATTICEAEAESWRSNLKKLGYAPATISRTVRYARQFYRWAVRRRLAPTNPFSDLKAGAQTNPSRKVFVPRETIDALLAAAPDAQWRLLICLSRFGGLRTPSEALLLTWDDIDWAKARIRVRSPKTEHHEGCGERIIPLFPELREPLREVFETAPEGSVYVISRYRSGANLNTHLRRIMTRAGVKPWPKAWHNLRASRQTELANQFPMHMVCKWIGNSKDIAADHYLMITEADFARAAGLAPSSTAQGSSAATDPATHPLPPHTNGTQTKKQNPRNCEDFGGLETAWDVLTSPLVGRAGLEPATLAFSMRCSTN
jgi:integrase